MPQDNENVNQQAAEQTVFDNLGLSKEELGAGDIGAGESGFEQEQEAGFEQGQEQEQPQQEQPQQRETFERQPEQQRPQPFRNAPVKPDKRGNLVDAQGNIVARAGKEARLYTNAHNARMEAQRVGQERDEIHTRLERAIEIGQEIHRELEQYKAREEQVKQLGLEPHESLDAMQLAAEAKRDPVGALKKLLTRAAANGIDLTQIGLQPGGVDTKSLLDLVRSELSTQLKPVQERTAREQEAERVRRQEQEQNEATAREVNSFFSQNPQARPYVAVFQEVLKQPRFANMTLGEIWARIQLNMVQQQQNRPQRPSLPNGRGGVMSERTPNRPGIASPDQSYEDIIRDVINKAAPGRSV